MVKLADHIEGANHELPQTRRCLDVLLESTNSTLADQCRGKTVGEIRGLLGDLTVEDLVRDAKAVAYDRPELDELKTAITRTEEDFLP